MGADACNPNTGEAKVGIFLGLCGRHSNTFGEFQANEGILFQKNNLMTPEEEQLMLTPDLHIEAHTSACNKQASEYMHTQYTQAQAHLHAYKFLYM